MALSVIYLTLGCDHATKAPPAGLGNAIPKPPTPVSPASVQVHWSDR